MGERIRARTWTASGMNVTTPHFLSSGTEKMRMNRRESSRLFASAWHQCTTRLTTTSFECVQRRGNQETKFTKKPRDASDRYWAHNKFTKKPRDAADRCWGLI